MTTMPVVIHDISGEVDKYNLDTHGFQFVKHESKEKDFFDVEKIEAEYYPETEELVKKVTGATRTFVFNHAIRRQPVEAADGSVPGRGPTYNAHIDQSYADAPNRVRRYFPEEAEELIKKRYQIINVSLKKYTTIFKFIKRKRLLTVTTIGMAPY
jgi:mRNA-degrading endonuclease HigB of HigAB toxin-antitoxin module